MGEYRDQDMPAAALATERSEVVMNAWQRMVADFDADIADGVTLPLDVPVRYYFYRYFYI